MAGPDDQTPFNSDPPAARLRVKDVVTTPGVTSELRGVIDDVGPGQTIESKTYDGPKNQVLSRARYTPPKTNMTINNPPFEDVFPIENGEFPMSC